LKLPLENYSDAEYSYCTGNTEEFLNGKLAVFDALQTISSGDGVVRHLEQLILEDLIVGYCVGGGLKWANVPTELYWRRVKTHPFFVGSTVVENDGTRTVQIKERLFNTVSEEVLADIRGLMEDCKENSPHLEYLTKQFETAIQDRPVKPRDAFGWITIDFTKAGTQQQSRVDQNLKSYDELIANIEAEKKDMVNLIEKFDTAWKRSHSTKFMVTRKSENKFHENISYNVKMRIAEKVALNSKHRTLSKILDRSSHWCSIFSDLDCIAKSTLSIIQITPQLSMAPHERLIDLYTILVHVQDVERDLIEVLSTASLQPVSEDLLKSEYQGKVFDLVNKYLRASEIKNYPQENRGKKLTEAYMKQSLEERIDKLRGSIYSDYAKTKNISKQIISIKQKIQSDKEMQEVMRLRYLDYQKKFEATRKLWDKANYNPVTGKPYRKGLKK
jgi:hypothetical protein